VELESNPGASTETSLSLYFRQRLSACAGRLQPAPHEDTCWYLGTLLERFSRSDHLFSYQEGRVGLRPLALLYGEALEAGNTRERCLILQQLGDMALFLGALFPGHFTRRGIYSDYIIGMGGGAYDYLAENARQNRHIFAELSRTFARMLQVVAEACAREQALGVEEVIALYRRWLDTGDPRLAGQLAAVGIDLTAGTAHWH